MPSESRRPYDVAIFEAASGFRATTLWIDARENDCFVWVSARNVCVYEA